MGSASATVIYHRAWGAFEWFEPRDGVHGPAVLPLRKPVMLRSHFGNSAAAIFQDGRLWVDRTVGSRWPAISGGYFAPGSNWVDVAILNEETVAIRSDGTLWVSDKPGWPERLVQFGTGTGWKSAVRYYDYSVILLKRDGTLWQWGAWRDSRKVLGEFPCRQRGMWEPTYLKEFKRVRIGACKGQI